MGNHHYGELAPSTLYEGRKAIANSGKAFFEKTADRTDYVVLDAFISSGSGHTALPFRTLYTTFGFYNIIEQN